MRKIVMMFVLAMALMMTAVPVMAEGGKVRGDEGTGPTEQKCLSFGECPYGEENP